MGIGDGGHGGICLKIRAKKFRAKIMQNSGIVLIFHTYIFRKNEMPCPSKLTELSSYTYAYNIILKLLIKIYTGMALIIAQRRTNLIEGGL